MPRAVALNGATIEVDAWFEAHDRFDRLTQYGVEDADDCRFAHLRQAADDLFDFGGVDAVRAALDDVSASALQIQVTFAILPSDITGMQPAVANDGGRRFLVAQIAGHDVGSAGA